jgi:predicted nucleic acid-binding protein
VILVDTGPLVALCDRRDAKHRVAVKHLESLALAPMATCDAVLTEACFHLPHHNQRQRLRAMLEELGIQAIADTHDVAIWQDVFAWLAKYADQQPDWTDGYLAVLSARVDAAVWTYDREFKTAWRRPNGTAIPLAVRIN